MPFWAFWTGYPDNKSQPKVVIMATSFKNRKNKLLALLMALMMTSSFAALAACKDTTDSSSSDDTTTDTTPTETDDSHINNGSFEFVNRNNGKSLIVTSPTGWSRSTNSATSGTALSSSSASGIIDTDSEAWDNFTKSSLPDGTAAPKTADEARALWSQMSAYDKLTFYKAWDDADYDEKIEDQDFYDASKDKFNVDIDDVPVDKDGKVIENPGTHPQDGEEKDTNVLMLHNAYKGGVGTAQKFTSSSTITLQSGTSAKISLWVKTSDMTYNNGNTAMSDRGAYIGITHTVGGKTLDQMQVKNINTTLMTLPDENNGWAQYTFYLQGCSYASSTFSMVLGLGQTGGTDRFEYVEGYAFFDDVECEIISNEAYDDVVHATGSTIDEVSLSDEGEDKIFRADKDNKRDVTTYALNLTAGTTTFHDFALPTVTPALTEQKKNGKTYVAADDGNLSANRLIYNGLGFDVSADLTGVFTKDQLVAEIANGNANDTFVKAALEKGFGYKAGENNAYTMDKYPFESNQILMLLSAHGANYTAAVNSPDFTLMAGEKMGISFFVKTSDMLGITGATVTVKYADGSTALASIDTTGISTVDVDGDNGEDIYKGWQQCFLFVENDTETDNLSFSLEFAYGPTTIVGTTKANYTAGWAAFADFKTADMSDAFDYATAGSYSKVISLVDPNEETFSSSVFDSPASVTGKETIKTNVANPANYLGVVGGSGYIVDSPEADRSKNSNAFAGLISKEYAGAYLEEAQKAQTAGEEYWANLMGLDQAKMTALFKDGNKSYGEATQPLLIYNKEAGAYGFISTKSSSISAYTAISVRVKVSAGATATVYLVDTSDNSVLSIDRRVSYWYDKDGNVCKADPTSADFKKSDIVLELQDNGLWQAPNGGDYYANLKAYPQYGVGDLLVAEGGVSYDYTSHWNDEGEDGIAFYYEGGKYYADRAKTVIVKDFSEKNIPTRYDAAEKKELAVTVGDTNGEWVTVTFYVGAGSAAKNYRLEVWSGDRYGKIPNPAGSYVMFDTNTAGSLAAESYNTLTQGAFDHLVTETDNSGNLVYENEEALKEALKNSGKLMYTAYSFYDDAKFLRYNANADENKAGSSYDDYDSTSDSYKEVLSYLYYENATNNAISVFANFTQNDVNVPVDVVEDDSTEDTTPEEEATESNLDLGMLISSLAVAGVLVAVLAIIGIRKAVKWSKKKAAQVVKPVRVKPTKPVKPVKEEKKDEDSPYND